MNWFSGNLPIEVKQRFDKKWNVWQMKTLTFDEGTELRWVVIAVCDSESEANGYVRR